jgi:hypothetical protein
MSPKTPKTRLIKELNFRFNTNKSDVGRDQTLTSLNKPPGAVMQRGRTRNLEQNIK